MISENQIVWAKVDDVWWPSKVINVSKDAGNQKKSKYLVETFATSKKVKLENSYIEDFASNFEDHSKKRTVELQCAINQAMEEMPYTRMKRLDKFKGFSELENLSKFLDSNGNFDEEEFELTNGKHSKTKKEKSSAKKKGSVHSREDVRPISAKIRRTMPASSKEGLANIKQQKSVSKSPTGKRGRPPKIARPVSLLKKVKQSSQDKFGKRVGKKMDKIEIAEVSVEETKTPEIRQKESELKAFLLELTKSLKHQETDFILEKPSDLKTANAILDDIEYLKITAKQHIVSDIGKLLKVLHELVTENQNKLTENGKVYLRRVEEMISQIKTAITEYCLNSSEIEQTLKKQASELDEMKMEEKLDEITTEKKIKTSVSKRKEGSAKKSKTKSAIKAEKPKTPKSKPGTVHKEDKVMEIEISKEPGVSDAASKEDKMMDIEKSKGYESDIEDMKKDSDLGKSDLEKPSVPEDYQLEGNKLDTENLAPVLSITPKKPEFLDEQKDFLHPIEPEVQQENVEVSSPQKAGDEEPKPENEQKSENKLKPENEQKPEDELKPENEEKPDEKLDEQEKQDTSDNAIVMEEEKPENKADDQNVEETKESKESLELIEEKVPSEKEFTQESVDKNPKEHVDEHKEGEESKNLLSQKLERKIISEVTRKKAGKKFQEILQLIFDTPQPEASKLATILEKKVLDSYGVKEDEYKKACQNFLKLIKANNFTFEELTTIEVPTLVSMREKLLPEEIVAEENTSPAP